MQERDGICSVKGARKYMPFTYVRCIVVRTAHLQGGDVAFLFAPRAEQR